MRFSIKSMYSSILFISKLSTVALGFLAELPDRHFVNFNRD